MDIAVIENYKIFSKRMDHFKEFGLDQIKEREFILEQVIPVQGEILEIGTGKGNFSVGLASRGYEFVSIDTDPIGQKIAKLNLAYYGLQDCVDFQIQNAEKLSFENNSFDIIVCVNAYHHFKNPIFILTEILRVISDNGKIVLSDFNAQGLGILEKVHALEGGKHECFNQSLDSAQEFFLAKGLEVKKISSLNQQVLVISRSV